jgi:hypothetical protein
MTAISRFKGSLNRRRLAARDLRLLEDRIRPRPAVFLRHIKPPEESEQRAWPFVLTTTPRTWPSAMVFSLSAGRALRIFTSLNPFIEMAPHLRLLASVPSLSSVPTVYPETSDGRYGYRRITSLLRASSWQVGCDRVQRVWRREGLKVPRKHKLRGRL